MRCSASDTITNPINKSASMSYCKLRLPFSTPFTKEQEEEDYSRRGGDPLRFSVGTPPFDRGVMLEGVAGMDSIPDGIIQHILSQLNNARDIALCSCISKTWNDSILFIPSLYFARTTFDSLPQSQSDAIITHMVSSARLLQELVIYCAFSTSCLASSLSACSGTLRTLELRMDSSLDKPDDGAQLDCIGVAKGLQVLKLWRVSFSKSPEWGVLGALRKLEIVGAAMMEDALRDALKACPNVTDLVMLGCDGVDTVVIEMERLENCRLEFLGTEMCSLSIQSPSIRALEAQGFGWVHVRGSHRLAYLCIAKTAGRVYKVDVGKLTELEYLCLRGIQWTWSAIHSLLQCASEVKHLVMKVEFCGDFDSLQPFPEIDLVDFCNGHPKLMRFEVHGAMFAALCQKNSLKNLDWRFRIPNLEEVVITVRSPLNAEQKLSTLESLVKCSEKLRKLVIRILQMKNTLDAADDFFEDIYRFKLMNNRIIHIE